MESGHLQCWHANPRKFLMDEMRWIGKLLDNTLRDVEILRDQIKYANVIGECKCGCRSINIKVDEDVKRYPYPERIPVEMIAHEQGKAPIMFLLHVVEGYMNELEVLRADSEPITGSIDLFDIEVLVKLQ